MKENRIVPQTGWQPLTVCVVLFMASILLFVLGIAFANAFGGLLVFAAVICFPIGFVGLFGLLAPSFPTCSSCSAATGTRNRLSKPVRNARNGNSTC